MRQETSELLSLIGAMQTLVANFPMGLLSSIKTKTYTSVIDFVMDCLKEIGIGDVEILNFILSDIFDVKLDLKNRDKVRNWMDNVDETTQNSKFVNGIEDVIKSTLSLILTELLSCNIHPMIPDYAMTGYEGINCPLTIIDPDKLLDTCPTSKGGRLIYMGIDNSWFPSDLYKAKDLNAVMWYSLYQGNTTWSGHTTKKGDFPICTLSNQDFMGINVKIDKGTYTNNGKNKSLYTFNRDYLNSITIFTLKGLVGYFLDYLFGGNLPSIVVSYNTTDIITQGMIDTIIKEAIEKDDLEIDDSYFGFSNANWIQMLEDTELKKYNGIRNSNGEIGQIDGQKLLEQLTQVSENGGTLFEQKAELSRIINNVEVTAATDTTGFVGGKFELNSQWVINITSLIVTPFIKCLFSPQVLSLLYINYEISGLINIEEVSDFTNVLKFFTNKIMGVAVQLVKIVKDMIIDLLLKLFKKTIGPLIEKYTLKLLMEYIEDYMAILYEALECVKLFDFGLNTVLTQIDNVNYADIIPEKITPQIKE